MSLSFAAAENPENERRRTLVALGISILAHLVIILLVAFLLGFRLPPPMPEEEEPVVELTIEPPPPVPAKDKPQYVDTNPAQAVEKPPENAPFESDNNTVAASELPAQGNAPVPTMEGKETQGLEMENRDYVAGIKPQQAAPPSVPTRPTETTPPQPTPQPTAAQASPSPMSTPRQTSQLALLEPPKPRETPRPTPEQQRPPQPESRPVPPSAPGYQPQTRVTRIQGNISNRGRASVAAQATPMGRYKKMLADAIGSRWYYYVNEQMGLINVGTLEVSFVVKADGKVEKVRVVSNTSNESFASCSVRAIMEAEIPPIPKELAPMLEGNRIEIDYTFTILSN